MSTYIFREDLNKLQDMILSDHDQTLYTWKDCTAITTRNHKHKITVIIRRINNEGDEIRYVGRILT